MTKKLLIAGLLPLFFACNSEDDNFSADVENAGKVSVKCSIDNGDTRTTLDESTYQSKWNTGDAVGIVFANKAFSFATIEGDQTTSVFTTSADTTSAGQALCAYYPYGNGEVSGKTNVTFTLDAAQVKNEKYTNFAEYDHMVAIAPPMAANMDYPFKRTLSLIAFKTDIDLFPAGINVGKVTVTDQNGGDLAGTYTVDMTQLPTAQTYTVEGGKSEMTTTLVAEPTANNCLAYACVLPGAGRKMTMMIEGAGDAAGIKMKINYGGGQTFEAGKYYEYMVKKADAQYVWFNFGTLANTSIINQIKGKELLPILQLIKDYDYDGDGTKDTTGTVGRKTWIRLTDTGLQLLKTTIQGMLL